MPTFRLPDPDRRWSQVSLDAGPVGGPCRFVDGGWERTVSPDGIQRLEFAFGVGRRGRRVLNPDYDVVETDFGPRSVWHRSDYREPGWLSAPATPGRLTTLELPSALAAPLAVRMWTPSGLRSRDPAPVLWCHDGSGYLDHARIDRWAGSHIAAGTLPAFRIVLADASRRMQWYSGSPGYLRTVRRALGALQERFPSDAPVAVAGASLGGLTSMLVGMRDPRVGVVFSQSGSFFDARIDKSDNAFRWFDRITREVAGISATTVRNDLHIGMVCGAREGNERLNTPLALGLMNSGWDVAYERFDDLHNWTGWRDSLDPMLPNLLREAWSAVG